MRYSSGLSECHATIVINRSSRMKIVYVQPIVHNPRQSPTRPKIAHKPYRPCCLAFVCLCLCTFAPLRRSNTLIIRSCSAFVCPYTTHIFIYAYVLCVCVGVCVFVCCLRLQTPAVGQARNWRAFTINRFPNHYVIDFCAPDVHVWRGRRHGKLLSLNTHRN